jgi:hypothetical protein
MTFLNVLQIGLVERSPQRILSRAKESIQNITVRLQTKCVPSESNAREDWLQTDSLKELCEVGLLFFDFLEPFLDQVKLLIPPNS